ncbi:MAG: AAA family ATPase [Candidatus Lokiarchaeota archaeon]|nr:AAA family ATPase [Candidatus Lokiarchaeota archaeon]
MIRIRDSVKNPKIICLEGIHGVGKTTVFQMLKRNRESSTYKFYPERLAVKPLWPFGSRDKQIAFRAETHFMQQMIKRNQIIQDDIKNKRLAIGFLDRSAISVMVYSRALELPFKDKQVLIDYFNSVDWVENIIFYLEASMETIFNRIIKRGSLNPERLKWNEDDVEYIKKLQKQYDAILAKCKTINVIRIRTDNLTPQDTAEIIINKLNHLFPKAPPPPGQELIDNWINKNS